MTKSGLPSPSRVPAEAAAKAPQAVVSAEFGHDADGATTTVPPRTCKVYEASEGRTSAHFLAAVKGSPHVRQAETARSIEDFLAGAPRNLFRKHNVPVAVAQGEGG